MGLNDYLRIAILMKLYDDFRAHVCVINQGI